jgi:uncharacterized protein with HEPN domain
MSSAKEEAFLKDILEAIRRIQAYTKTQTMMLSALIPKRRMQSCAI